MMYSIKIIPLCISTKNAINFGYVVQNTKHWIHFNQYTMNMTVFCCPVKGMNSSHYHWRQHSYCIRDLHLSNIQHNVMSDNMSISLDNDNCTSHRQYNNTTASQQQQLSSMQKHFLVVFVLAAINCVLGLIYLYLINYAQRPNNKNKRKKNGDVVLSMNRRSRAIERSVHEQRQKKRRMSTHIAVSIGRRKHW